MRTGEILMTKIEIIQSPFLIEKNTKTVKKSQLTHRRVLFSERKASSKRVGFFLKGPEKK